MHAQMYAHIHRRTHTRAQTCVQIHICVLAHVHRGVRTHYIHVCSHMCTYIHIRVLACMQRRVHTPHTHVLTRVQRCACTCTHMCSHMHIHICAIAHMPKELCEHIIYSCARKCAHRGVCIHTHAHAHGGPGSCKEGTGGRSGGPAVRRTRKGVTSGDISFPKKKFKNAWEESRKEEPDGLRAPGAIGAAVSLHTLTTVRGGDTASLSQCKAAKSRAI